MDLTQAEAVLGVIDADSPAELNDALAQLAGGMARPLHQLRDDLLQLLAELEAGLDFVDEDIEFIGQEKILARLQSAEQLLAGVGERLRSRRAFRPAKQVVLCGPPNVGKSSLFNAIVKRFGWSDGDDAPRPTSAIVSPHQGTTRDYLTATISLDGVACELVDTAGVDGHDDTTTVDDSIGTAAQAAAGERRNRAAIRAICIAAPAVASLGTQPELELADIGDCEVVVWTKCDLGAARLQSLQVPAGVPVVSTSSLTGAGIDDLGRRLRTLLTCDAPRQSAGVVAATAERCDESVRFAAGALATAAEMVRQNAGDELVAAELRVALDELGKVVGAVYTDDLLDRIFRTFCIGK